MGSGRKMPAKLYLSLSASLSSFQTVDLMVCPMLPSCSIPSFLSSPLFAPSFLPLHPISPYFIWLLSCCFLVSLSVCLVGWGNARNKREKSCLKTHTHTLCLSLSSLAFSLSLSLSLSLWCSHWHTYTLSLSLSLFLTHTLKDRVRRVCVCVHSAEGSIFIGVEAVLLNEIPYRDHIDSQEERGREGEPWRSSHIFTLLSSWGLLVFYLGLTV